MLDGARQAQGASRTMGRPAYRRHGHSHALRGHGAGALHPAQEGPLLAQDETPGLRHSEVGLRRIVRAEPRAVGLVRGQALERDHGPGDVVRALVRQEVAEQAAAQARDGAPPVGRVLAEPLALKRIELITDEAGDHGAPPVVGWNPPRNVPLALQEHFDYGQTMDGERGDARAATIAATIGEPARARMLFVLVDGRARTSTELAVVGGVTPSTASVHLQRLRVQGLVRVSAQGKHRYYHLAGPRVAAALEALSVLAGGSREDFAPHTPHRLRFARSCYDHLAGTLGVRLHDRLLARRWLAPARGGDDTYSVSAAGVEGLAAIGVEVAAARARHRRFAFACLDWSERRPHLGGALGAALLAAALERRWVAREMNDRCLRLTGRGRRELAERLQVDLPEPPGP